MHKLTLLECAPVEQFKLIIEGKRGANRLSLDATLRRVTRRYEHFEERFNIDDLCTVRPGTWSDNEAIALLHCYNAEVTALTELKTLIKEAQPLALRSICPYCGIGDPVQFDHYIPKSRFPELAVHAYNLAPCCGPCNGLKSETWLVNGARSFVNFYLDSLPTASILATTVTWRKFRQKMVPAISFGLVRPARFSAARFQLIQRHFERLNLLSRYAGQAPSDLYQFLDSSLILEARTAARLRTALQRFIDGRERRIGALHWKLSLYRALVADQTFLDMCLS